MLAVDAVRVDVRVVDAVAGEDLVAVEAVVDAVLEVHLDVVADVILLDELLAAAEAEVLDARRVPHEGEPALQVLLREGGRLAVGGALEAGAAQVRRHQVREEGRLPAELLVAVAAREDVLVQLRGGRAGRPGGVRGGGGLLVAVVIDDVRLDLGKSVSLIAHWRAIQFNRITLRGC